MEELIRIAWTAAVGTMAPRELQDQSTFSSPSGGVAWEHCKFLTGIQGLPVPAFLGSHLPTVSPFNFQPSEKTFLTSVFQTLVTSIKRHGGFTYLYNTYTYFYVNKAILRKFQTNIVNWKRIAPAKRQYIKR